MFVSFNNDVYWTGRKRRAASVPSFLFCCSLTVKMLHFLYCLLSCPLSVAQWLRCCATNQKVAGSIPDGVIGIFHWHNPSDCTMTLGSTQRLTEMSTRRFSRGKCGRCVRLTTLLPSCAVVMKTGNLNSLEPSGPLQDYNGTALPSFIRIESHSSRCCDV